MVLRIQNLGAIVFRTMERPERIIGFETADACPCGARQRRTRLQLATDRMQRILTQELQL